VNIYPIALILMDKIADLTDKRSYTVKKQAH